MRVLGIDPGSLVTGFGVVDIDESAQIEMYVTSGTIRLKADRLSDRLQILYNDLHSVFEEYRPESVVVESVFANINWRSALIMGHARGVILLVAKQYQCHILELQPRTVKKCITGTGSASKSLVASMVGKRLGLMQELQVDASDALALALSYRYHSKKK